MLKIRGLKKSFGKTTVLKCIDLDIMEGEIVVIVVLIWWWKNNFT